MSHWYVVATHSRKESLAERHLRNQDFEIFLPTRLKTVRHARKVSTGPAPLFPGYLFVNLDESSVRWRAINGTIGVRYLLAAGDRPLALPSGFVSALKALTVEGGTLSFAPHLKIGEEVKVLSGPFAEKIGVLQRLDDRGRVRVLLELLSTSIPVEMRAENLLPA